MRRTGSARASRRKPTSSCGARHIPASSMSRSPAGSSRRRPSWTASRSSARSRRCFRRRPKDGLTFKPTHPEARKRSPGWASRRARRSSTLLDQAIAEKAEVRVVAYDLSEPEVVGRLREAEERLRIIIDDSKEHGEAGSGETQSAKRLEKTAGKANVKRQHMKSLQHNKMIIVDGPKTKKVVFGSTNLSWRGLYVQANNALVVEGKKRRRPGARRVRQLLRQRRRLSSDTDRLSWSGSGSKNIDAKVAFSPHSAANALLDTIGEDIGKTTSCLFYSLAFLSITPGVIKEAIKKVSKKRRDLRLRHRRQEGRRHRAADAERQHRAGVRLGARQERPGAVQQGADRRRRQSHAPQVRRDRFRQADRAGLPRLLQLLDAGRQEERREPAARSGTGASRCPTPSRRCASSTTTTSASRSRKRRRRRRSCSSLSHHARRARSRGSRMTTRIRARSGIESCSRKRASRATLIRG